MIIESPYNGLIEIGSDGQPIVPSIILSSRGGHKIGIIQNVQNVQRTHPMNGASELSFDVYKYTQDGVCANWDLIQDFKFVNLPYDNDWYEIHVSVDEELDTIKHVTCSHANEAELGQVMLFETEINTEADIDRDDYKETVFYDSEDPDASLLNRILKDKAPHYQIYHVDDSLKNLFRAFSFNGTSIYDALSQISTECECLFVFGEWYENDGKYHRTISAYDLLDTCNTCGKRGNYTQNICENCGSTDITSGYGEDTNIYISVENIAQNITYSGNPNSVKNCFRLVAGDDIVTTAVKTCNPSMSQYLWYFSDAMKADMSEELRDRLDDYEERYNEFRDTETMNVSSVSVANYNVLVNKYDDYNEDLVNITYPINGTVALTDAYYNSMALYDFLKTTMLPASEAVRTTTAQEQMDKLLAVGAMDRVGVASTTNVTYTVANSAIQSYAKVYIDFSRYSVSVFTTNITGNVNWTGTIKLTAYANDEDTCTETFNITLFDDVADYSEWLEQKVQKAIANKKTNDIGNVSLFDTDTTLEQFQNRIKLYSLDNLEILRSMAEACLSVLTEQGVATPEHGEELIYEQIYLPYYQKSQAVIAEINLRENELSQLLRPTDDDGNPLPLYTSDGLIDEIEKEQTRIRNLLDLQLFLGDELWEELSFYRREQEYSNSNFISDGLTDSEVIDRARQFFETAQKEIVKSATLQHTIDAKLDDLLLLPEFYGFQDKFALGNWIHLRVDDNLYKLRLIKWVENYSSIEEIEIEFSDVIRSSGTVSDVASILSQAKSMATTYQYTSRQANKGAKANETVKVYKDSGISFADIKAISSKGNTNILYDDNGILLRRTDDDGLTFSPEQARIYNNGIYVTKDAWETVSTGLGHYSYIDPETGETVEAYGIIADTVIGRLILGENLKIFSENGKFEMGDNGLIITAKDGEDNTNLFTVQKETTDEQGRPIYEKYIYVNSDGEVVIAGNSVVIDDKPLVEYIDEQIEDLEVSLPITIQIDSSAGNIFKNKLIYTILTATVYKGGEDITNQIASFHWTKKNSDGTIDPTWGRYTTSNTITINTDDVTSKAVFGCEVTVIQ